MPKETQKAVMWSLKQCEYTEEFGEICVVENGKLRDSLLFTTFVREYYNKNNVEYERFNFNDLKPYIPNELLN